MITASKLLEIARTEIGTREANGANNVKYNSAYYGGTVRGDKFEWCVVFVWWCFREANALDLFCYGKKTASTSYVKNAYAREKDFYTDPTEFRSGDLAIFDWSGKQKDTVHIGIIDEIDVEAGYVYTIEGNTSGDGGEGVYRKKRHLSLITGVCRPAYDQEDVPEISEPEIEGVPEPILPQVPEQPNEPEQTPSDIPEEPNTNPPTEETPPETEISPPVDENVLNEETGTEAENKDTPQEKPSVEVYEKPLPFVEVLNDEAGADLDLVAISATGRIYPRNTETVRVSRSFLSIRLVNGLGEKAIGKFNINGYEFVFEGSARIPEKYLKPGQNDIAFTSSDGNVYTSHCFVKVSNRITPIGISQSEMVDIAQAYEKVLALALSYEERISLLEKSAAGVDLADIILSDKGLGELSEALESIANTNEESADTETPSESADVVTNENTSADTESAETEITE